MRQHTFISHCLVLAAAVMLLGACLDENPRDRLSDDDTYTSAKNLYINAVATLYNYIGGSSESQGLMGTYRGVYDYNTFTTDEAIIPIRGGDWYDGGFWQDLFNHNWKPKDQALYNTWAYLYKVVVLANESLATIDHYSSLLTEEQYKAYNAEVRALRAMFYYYIMDMYGNVPLVEGSSTSGADSLRLEFSQISRSRMMRYVVSELQQTAPLLSDEHSNYEGSYYGRITRPVAWFLLAKIALNAEVYADDDWTDSSRPDGSQLMFDVGGSNLNAWQTCIAYCDSITAAGYTLAEHYADNFLIHNENSPENIFIIPMDKIKYGNQFQYIFRSHHYAQGGARSMASENGSCATVSTALAYGYGTDTVDTRFDDNFYADTVYFQGNVITLDNGQPLVYYPLEVEINLTYSPYIQTAGARMKKYEEDPTAFNDAKNGDNDIVLFRYADVLLMRSEALVRSGNDGSSELNMVRRRAGMPEIRATLASILRERRLELMWEGWRRQDLIRYGLYQNVYDGRESDGESDGHTSVFPIPSTAIDLNPSLSQNPGYEKN